MRNEDATILLPSADEWYKGAYYDPQTAGYFDYPAGSDTVPLCTFPGTHPRHGELQCGGQ